MTIINTVDELGELLALALDIEAVEGLTRGQALRRAVHYWAALGLDIEADMRYLPAGETIRPHVSLAAGVPALEMA